MVPRKELKGKQTCRNATREFIFIPQAHVYFLFGSCSVIVTEKRISLFDCFLHNAIENASSGTILV